MSAISGWAQPSAAALVGFRRVQRRPRAGAARPADRRRPRGVPLVAMHTWWRLVVDPVLAPLLDWDVIEADERRPQLAEWAEK